MAKLDVKQISWMRYKPTKSAEEFLGDLRTTLRLPDKASAGRLAIARSLAEPPLSVKELELSNDLDMGTPIQGVHLFGDDGDLWGSLIASSVTAPIATTNEFRCLVEEHWHRGAEILKRDYLDSDRDDISFIVKLANMIPGEFVSTGTAVDGVTITPVSHLINVSTIINKEPWQLNASGGNGLLVISGKPGSGKSQLALDLLAQASNQGIKFLFFDLKGELEESTENQQQNQKRKDFLDLTKADYIRLIDNRLPINPLFKGQTSAENAQISSEVAHLVRSFASQLGANQERAIKESFEGLDEPDFSSLAEALQEYPSDAGVAYSIIDKISSFNIFTDYGNSINIGKWLSTSKIIDFKRLGNDNDTKALVVAFVLNVIMRQLNNNLPVTNGVQPLQMVLFVDEAHLLLPKEGKAGLLGSLARQGRSWGFPVWLASQDADAFITKGQHTTNFAELSDCGIHLSPSTLSDSQQKSILGQVLLIVA